MKYRYTEGITQVLYNLQQPVNFNERDDVFAYRENDSGVDILGTFHGSEVLVPKLKLA